MEQPSHYRTNCFTPLEHEGAISTLPEEFTFPFYYTPHPLCLTAANDLQEYLNHQQQFDHNFGLDSNDEQVGIGKMFGILIVQDKTGALGYLSAYSGKLAGKNNHPAFVPPVFDLLNQAGFYKKEELVISKINQELQLLEENATYIGIKKTLFDQKDMSQNLLTNERQLLKIHKKERKQRRVKAEKELSPTLYLALQQELKKESLDQQHAYKRLVHNWKGKIEILQASFDIYHNRILALKLERKQRSAALQKKIFQQFTFLNNYGESASLFDIFKDTIQHIPPSGAGECAAPKLLNYAYLNKMKPVAMAEFWWGVSPSSEIRKHKLFYPSCRGKCEPILGHMLQGLTVEENPITKIDSTISKIECLFEDSAVVVINKPANLLSVPGKTVLDSVFTRVKELYPTATGPLIVHRLDMSTSGLMLIAKTKDVHKKLQRQFIDRTICKRYIALLDGIVDGEEGEIDLPLRVDLNNRPHQLVCYHYGKAALTRWKLIHRKSGKSRVSFTPITGRTHQLRVHAAHQLGLNIPIIGDDLYGKKDKRLHLHAAYISFTHPLTKERMEFQKDPEF